MKQSRYLVQETCAHLLKSEEMDALNSFVERIVRVGESQRKTKIADAVDRFCAELEINLLDVVERRLSTALVERIDHRDDCRMAAGMELRCTCGARISCALPLTMDDLK